MKALSGAETLFTHARLTRARGGRHGVRDAAALKAALAKPSETFDGQPLYPDDFQKAAALLGALAEAKAFNEGNLSTAFAVTLLALRRGGYAFALDAAELNAFAQRVRTGQVLLLEMAVWIRKRCE
jgi:death-on-curing protein